MDYPTNYSKKGECTSIKLRNIVVFFMLIKVVVKYSNEKNRSYMTCICRSRKNAQRRKIQTTTTTT